MDRQANRNEFKKLVFEKLNTGKNIAIYAPQFLGKSSFFDLLIEETKNGNIIVLVKFEYIFCLDDFYTKIKNEIKNIFKIDYESKKEDTLERLKDELVKFCELCNGLDKRVFFFIDDFDEVEKLQGVKMELNKVLKESFSDKENIVFCFAIKSSFGADVFTSKKSDLFEFAEILDLPRLTNEEVANFFQSELNEYGIKIPQSLIELVANETNNMPYYFRSVCSEIILNRRTDISEVSKEDVLNAIDEVYKKNRYIFMLQMRGIKGRKYISQILLKIAIGANPYELVSTEATLPKSNLSTLLSSLVKENMIVKVKEPKSMFVIYDPFLKRYILEIYNIKE
ncbi:TPA: hypothetical protein RPW15_001871 [Campylobacter fetus subsp. venerealis]|nr:hypothetical protein [Campylobacter fetus subsp. venerealis]HDX6253944.1 hypothetical protein [Campylobacter fetus subsp. venerealis]HDX6258132.1 hypothetical protein [Campylobacter fetus subsp. venerealis]HDX6262258.1 hypothetical protein [Campylobacter fetus subsp. venerealis]HDX6263921.1 hypothetical protein [Campylobacter fetus subsp. venerealis]